MVVVQQAAPETSPIFARGSHGFELHENVASRPCDHRVEKALPSCFADTDLGDWLDAHSIDTIAIVGYMTQNCDESTAEWIDAVRSGAALDKPTLRAGERAEP